MVCGVITSRALMLQLVVWLKVIFSDFDCCFVIACD